MSKSPDAFRTISEVADWLGVQAHVLRFWESKFTQIKPVKRAGGRRYYRPADMQLLGGIKRLLHDDGKSIKEVQALLREHGVTHVAGFSHPLDTAAEETPAAVPPADRLGDDWQSSLALPQDESAQDDAFLTAGADTVVSFPQQPAAEPARPDGTLAPVTADEPSPAAMDEPAAPAAVSESAPPLMDSPSQEVTASEEAPAATADLTQTEDPAPLEEQPAAETQAPDTGMVAAEAEEVQQSAASELINPPDSESTEPGLEADPWPLEEPAPLAGQEQPAAPASVAESQTLADPDAFAGPAAGLEPESDPAEAAELYGESGTEQAEEQAEEPVSALAEEPSAEPAPVEDTLVAAAGLQPDEPLDFGVAMTEAAQASEPCPEMAADPAVSFPPHDLDEAARQVDALEFSSGFKADDAENSPASQEATVLAAEADTPAPAFVPQPGILAHLAAIRSLPPQSVAGIKACAEELRALAAGR